MRVYRAGDREVRLRLLDTNLQEGSKTGEPRPAYEDGERQGWPLRTAHGVVGYLERDKASGGVRADLVVGDRLLVSLSAEAGVAPAELERMCMVLELERLGRLVADSPRTAP